MSAKHPIISVYGSSGTKRAMVRDAFDRMCRRLGVIAAFVDGESFHRYDRQRMKQVMADELAKGNAAFSHFGPDANLFDELEELFRQYGERGVGQRRHYLHTDEDVALLGSPEMKPGQFTPWEPIPPGTDFLVYEGLHGAVRADDVNLIPHTDLRIGVAPVINLEWIQKIHRDTNTRGYSEEAVMETILRRMPDYVRYIVPQFSKSDINFQRVPVVDTSDPIISRDVPTDDETMIVIRFRRPEDFDVDFPFLLREIDGSWMTRRNTLIIPGGRMQVAMELILTPIIQRLVGRRRQVA